MRRNPLTHKTGTQRFRRAGSDENVEAKEKRINLERVPKGIYILEINSNEHLYFYKISII